MKRQRGGGLIVALVTVFLVALIFWGLFAKPKNDGVVIEGYDPNKSVLEQQKDLVDQARAAKSATENKNNEEGLE